MSAMLRLLVLAVVGLSLAGCPLSMEPFEDKLLFRNNSDLTLKILLNLKYPDSTLSHAIIDRYIDPRSDGYIGSSLPLDRVNGLTVIVFDEAHYSSRWYEHCGPPEAFLDEDEILARYVCSKARLDSLNWTLVYP